jgi:predicted  nucleic acid-binding Zn-ribbon protein
MLPEIESLRELQALDQRIAELTREISYLPKHIAEIESRLDSHRRKLEADRAALTANQKERRQLEDDIKVIEQKMTHLRDQMSEAKTNEQYRAFQHEIDYGQSEIRKLEDRILDRMAEAETLDQNVKSAEASLKQESQEVEKEKKEAEARTNADRAELTEMQQRRKAATQGITSGSISIYERVRKQRGLAVAEARDGRCTACNVILRLHFYQQVRANTEVLTCEACGRILFYMPPQDPTVQDAPDAPKEEVADCRLQSAEPRP